MGDWVDSFTNEKFAPGMLRLDVRFKDGTETTYDVGENAFVFVMVTGPFVNLALDEVVALRISQ